MCALPTGQTWMRSPEPAQVVRQRALRVTILHATSPHGRRGASGGVG